MTDTDRLALSNELFNLAERFAIEATNWAEPTARENLEHTARHLSQLGRSALTSLDPETGYAYADAGDTLARQVESARRFLQALDHRPVTPAPGGRGDARLEQLPSGRVRVTCLRCSCTVGTHATTRHGYATRRDAIAALRTHRRTTHQPRADERLP